MPLTVTLTYYKLQVLLIMLYMKYLRVSEGRHWLMTRYAIFKFTF